MTPNELTFAHAVPTSNAAFDVSSLRLAVRLLRNRLVLTGLLLLVPLFLASIGAGIWAPFDPSMQDFSVRLRPPSVMHWLGTDQFGRDILSRVLFGTRTTIGVVAAVVICSVPLGFIVGTAAGYCGGWIDTALMRITDVFMAFPQLVLAITLAAVLGPGMPNAVIAIAFTAWPPFARLARTETQRTAAADFVAVSRLEGASTIRILAIDILPIILPTIITRTTVDLAGIVLTAAGLGFLGLGTQPPTPELGAMIAEGREFLTNQWWVSTLPGAAIFLMSLGFNLLGDGVSETLDPRLS